MNKRAGYLISLALLLIVFASSAGGTLAIWAVRSETVNQITVGTVKGQIVEEYEQGQTVLPGDTIKKVATAKNSGTSDVLVRVKLTKAWGQTRDTDGILITDSALSTENIQITYDSEHWYFDSDDGYYYYIGVLKPGESTLPLLKEFTVAENSGNEYQGMQADINLHMECIQAGGNAISVWGKSLQQLGITYQPATAKTIETGVVFLSPESGFRFEAKEGDLFSEFKDLIPGESRSQTINIKNSYDGKTEIFLRAEFIGQLHATNETREFIDKLLKKYAIITITDEDGTVLYNGSVWGNLDVDSRNSDSMKYNISLGNFVSGKEKKLLVNLFLDPAVGNQYQKLLGLVKWSFEANGRASGYPSPDTGDTTYLSIYAFAMLLSGAGICLLLVKYKKKSKKAASAI